MSGSRLQGWVVRAFREFGWRDLGIAGGLALVLLFTDPAGGYFLIPLHDGVSPLFDPGKHRFQSILRTILAQTLPLVLAIKVADRAIDDGVSPWRAYPLVLLTVVVWSYAFRQLPLPAINRSAEHVGRVFWGIVQTFIRMSTVLALYALWRARRRAQLAVQASEAQRARDQQRLQSAQLLALQARVDPQLLFDTLRHVGTLWRRDLTGADALLGHMIALLRATLPRSAATSSTVEREFTVVDAWLRVRRALSSVSVELELDPADGLANASLAPMLMLPLLRTVLDVPGADHLAWQLGAESAGGRLLISMSSPAGDAQAVASTLHQADLASLRERVALVYGDAAHLWIARTPPLLSLDLPLTYDGATD